jgi:hypothetical protein
VLSAGTVLADLDFPNIASFGTYTYLISMDALISKTPVTRNF